MYKIYSPCPQAVVWVDMVGDEGDWMAIWHGSTPRPSVRVALRWLVKRYSWKIILVIMSLFWGGKDEFAGKALDDISVDNPSTHFLTTSARPQLGPAPCCFLSPPTDGAAIEATSVPPPPFPNLSLYLFTAGLHNSLARQSSKNSVCLITTTAPPPFYWSVCVCVGVWAHCFSSKHKEV